MTEELKYISLKAIFITNRAMMILFARMVMSDE